MTPLPSIAARLHDIYERIANAKAGSKLAGISITLIAVSKAQPSSRIEEAMKAGQKDFGENRMQEILEKWPLLKERYPEVRLHFIGALQTNKADEAVEWSDVIHSIDRERLADAVKKAMDKRGKKPDCFIQVNTGEESQKGGVIPSEADALIEYCKKLGLPIIGLMCVPPAEGSPAPHFGLLAKTAKRHGLKYLSMGMSADFETAISFGATHVRVGTAIFGERLSDPACPA